MKAQTQLLALLFLFLTSFSANAKATKESEQIVKEQVATTENIPEAISKKFIAFYENGTDEKLYIQTDKPYYSAGENIWFKAIVVNAITHKPLTASEFVYIELIDQRDSLFVRTKIKRDDFGFHNSIELPSNITPGEYTLRGYTQWMRNRPEQFYYHKKITIVNPIDDNISLKASYNRKSDGNVDATINFATNYGQTIANNRIDYTFIVDGKERQGRTTTDENGVAQILLPPNLSSPHLELISTNVNYKFTKSLFLPAFDSKIDVQFFPEGGALIDGAAQSVVFEALGANGKGQEIEGFVYNNSGDKVAKLDTQFKGKGRFNLFVSKEQKYYAIVSPKQDTTQQLRFELPAVTESGCAIKAVYTKEKLIYQICATPDIDPTKVGMVIHSRGHLISAYKFENFSRPGLVNLSDVPEGILTLSLVDLESYNPISERLAYVTKVTNNSIISKNSNKYGSRQNVALELDMKDYKGKGVEGSFAISVTDRNSVDLKLQKDNIISSLMFSSDIKGYIEDEADYFTTDTIADMMHRDLVMLSNGWKRFDLGNVLRNSLPANRFDAETSHTIEGSVKGFFGNGAKKASIVVMCNNNVDKYALDNNHKFTIYDIDYPDSTKYTIQAIGRTGGTKSLTLKIKPEIFPRPQHHYPTINLGEAATPLPENFIMQSKEKYYTDGGMNIFEVDEVTVISKRENEIDNTYGVTPTASMSKEEMEMNQHLSVLEALSLMPGVQMRSDGLIAMSGNDTIPLIYVDDIPTEIDFIRTIQMSSVDDLSLVEGADASIFGPGADAGVVLITLKKGASLAGALPTSPSLAIVQQLGYKKPTAFYQPKYNDPKVLQNQTPDLRTTIYWSPEIITDTDGKAIVNFFTADNETTYDVTVEGVSRNGDIIRTTTTLERKN